MFEFRYKGDTLPDAKSRGCNDCKHLKGAVSLWCTSDEACKARGSHIPGVIHCTYWEAMERARWYHKFDFETSIVDLSD